MPTTPSTPASAAAVDRLALEVTEVRGTGPSNYGGVPTCFEAEASNINVCVLACVCADCE